MTCTAWHCSSACLFCRPFSTSTWIAYYPASLHCLSVRGSVLGDGQRAWIVCAVSVWLRSSLWGQLTLLLTQQQRHYEHDSSLLVLSFFSHSYSHPLHHGCHRTQASQLHDTFHLSILAVAPPRTDAHCPRLLF